MSHDSELHMNEQSRSRWMRLDTAHLLKRFFFCQRSLIISQAAWIPLIAPLEIKTALARFIWQNAETAHALRERVFELRFPSRLFATEASDGPLVDLFDAVKHSPSPAAFLSGIGNLLLPALRDGMAEYVRASDPIADGPTHRFLRMALIDMDEQLSAFKEWSAAELSRAPGEKSDADMWVSQLAERLSAIGGVGVETQGEQTSIPALEIPARYAIPDRPARDARFWPCRFYWPDVVDPAYPYGEGLQLQIRAAISHINEVWAIEAGGIMLSSFADVLSWEWIHDAARWTYDESRHCRMGFERLRTWSFDPAEIPLGTYIYDSASGHDPIYRLGMLYFFETKNIKHKLTRAQRFRAYGDRLSEHDMDFDWADETIHAGYGKHWLKELLLARGEDPGSHESIRQRCGELVREYVVTATPQEVADLKERADAMLQKSRQLC
jgi:uncharacterized ferritin-like protein (DUF455 family)